MGSVPDGAGELGGHTWTTARRPSTWTRWQHERPLGDEAALDQLLSEIQPRVRRICGRMLLYPEDAEEAAQDALLLVSTRIQTFAGRSRFTTWLHAVASNSARSTYRSLKRRSAELPTDELPTAADPRTTSVIAGSRLDFLEALEILGERPSRRSWSRLLLRDVQELDYAEIASPPRHPGRHREVAHPLGAPGRAAAAHPSLAPTTGGPRRTARRVVRRSSGSPR